MQISWPRKTVSVHTFLACYLALSQKMNEALSDHEQIKTGSQVFCIAREKALLAALRESCIWPGEAAILQQVAMMWFAWFRHAPARNSVARAVLTCRNPT